LGIERAYKWNDVDPIGLTGNLRVDNAEYTGGFDAVVVWADANGLFDGDI
jgi:hypothetical protein